MPAPGVPDAGVSGVDAAGDIVVTAQRSADVAQGLAVVTAHAPGRSGAGSPRGSGRIAPGVRVSPAGSFTQPVTHRVATLINGSGNNVAVRGKGFYERDPVTTPSNPINPQDIEALKGSEDTLHGRVTTGGVIRIDMLAPSAATADVSCARFTYNGSVLGDCGAIGMSRHADVRAGYRS